jgi:hypothetical protein
MFWVKNPLVFPPGSVGGFIGTINVEAAQPG